MYPEKTHLHAKSLTILADPRVQISIISFPSLSHRVRGPNPRPSDHPDMLYALHPPGPAGGSIRRLPYSTCVGGGERTSHHIPLIIVGYQGRRFWSAVSHEPVSFRSSGGDFVTWDEPKSRRTRAVPQTPWRVAHDTQFETTSTPSSPARCPDCPAPVLDELVEQGHHCLNDSVTRMFTRALKRKPGADLEDVLQMALRKYPVAINSTDTIRYTNPE